MTRDRITGRHVHRRDPSRLRPRAISFGRAVQTCNRIIPAQRHRCVKLLFAIYERGRKGNWAIVFGGDERMGAESHQSASSVHRAKYELWEAHLIRLHHSRPGHRGGGRIRNEAGETVACATGFELDEQLLKKDIPAPPADRERSQRLAETLEGIQGQRAAKGP